MRQLELQLSSNPDIPPLCKCGCGDPVTWNSKGRWNKYLKNHDKRRPKPWRYDNSNAPLCACGCGNTVVRSQQTPYNWNEYVHNHHRATESFVQKRWIKPPLCACGCGQKVSLKYLNRGWRKYVSEEHQLSDPKYHELLSERHSYNEFKNVCPNKLESSFDEATSDSIEFVGNRAFWCTFTNGRHKNPDFKIVGQKKVIELWGTYWHKGENPEELIKHFEAIGVECMVIWEHDWKEKRDSILGQVNQFIGENNE